MSRSPIDRIAANSKPYGQDGIWSAIRTCRNFNIRDIMDMTDIHRKTVTDYVRRLEAGGYVELISEAGDIHRFSLIKDAGIHAPRLKKDGSPVTQGKGNENIWRSMRMMPTFSPQDLAVHSTTETVKVGEDTARAYWGHLLKADYLRVVRKAVPGKTQAVYRLIKDTGPQPPQIQRVKQIFDPNLNQVVYYPGAAK